MDYQEYKIKVNELLDRTMECVHAYVMSGEQSSGQAKSKPYTDELGDLAEAYPNFSRRFLDESREKVLKGRCYE